VLAKLLSLIDLLGASPVELEASLHDTTIAAISHLPQITSSLLALTLEDLATERLALAGQGLRDVSRLAASRSELWSELLHANRLAVKPFVDKMIKNLTDLSTALESDDQRKSEELLALGRDVHARIPGKHGGKKRDYWYLPIVIDDRPGQLAGIFDACERVGANVEDLTIEHTPGLENGMVTLAMAQSGAQALYSELSSTGWKVHMPRESMG
jgi:prephenate dehydrogenase